MHTLTVKLEHNKNFLKKEKDTDIEFGPLGELGNRWEASFSRIDNVSIFPGNLRSCT